MEAEVLELIDALCNPHAPFISQCLIQPFIQTLLKLEQTHWLLMFASGSWGEILEGGILLHPITLK